MRGTYVPYAPTFVGVDGIYAGNAFLYNAI